MIIHRRRFGESAAPRRLEWRSSRRRQLGRHDDDRGQATVELALCIPLVLMLVLGIVQIAVVARDRMAVELAAREGARAAAVSADPTTAARLAVDRVLSLERVDVSVAVGGDTVTVTVRTVNPTDVAMIGALLPDVTITGRATMAVEPPDP